MLELKFRDAQVESTERRSCSCAGSPDKSNMLSLPTWGEDIVMTPAGPAIKASTLMTNADYWEHFKCRTTSYRNDCRVSTGLYAVGSPDNASDVLVSANYKYSFDMLRRELKGLSAWILVLDTKGINVWCAAGKGTFGTDELIRCISSSCLHALVEHRRIIVPQLGAAGVSAFRIKQATGFQVLFGPVYSKDIPAYIRSGYKATKDMRIVKFNMADRLVLTPMEIAPAMKKFLPFAAVILLLFGLTPSGIIFKDAWTGGLPFLILGLAAVLAGCFFTPLLLPFIPFRSFAVKGWVMGLISTFVTTSFIACNDKYNILFRGAAYIFFPLVSSYLALQFTGSTTFTGMSGVKKELKIAFPIYLSAGAISVILLIIFKLYVWGVI